MTKLKRIHLKESTNYLYGGEAIFRLPEITYLNMDDIVFVGNFAGIGNMDSLETLFLNRFEILSGVTTANDGAFTPSMNPVSRRWMTIEKSLKLCRI